jgi:peptidoglycan/xylan/chitin deacetylase (PgdA/CDA1 family)
MDASSSRARRTLGRAATTLTAGLAVAAVAQALPGLLAVPAVRRGVAPRLAGVGAPWHVALTFDDGPRAESTPAVLAALDALGWRATFFMLGVEARREPAVAAAVAAAGHEIGLHGDAHRAALREPPWATVAALRRARLAIEDATGVAPRWYRPPYGVPSGAALAGARSLGLRPVLWTAMGRDWEAGATPASIVAAVAADLAPGGTVLLHDAAASGSWRAAVAALPLLAELFEAAGLRPGPLGEHGIPESLTWSAG